MKVIIDIWDENYYIWMIFFNICLSSVCLEYVQNLTTNGKYNPISPLVAKVKGKRVKGVETYKMFMFL